MTKIIKFYENTEKITQVYPDVDAETLSKGIFNAFNENNLVNYELLYNFDDKTFISDFTNGTQKYQLKNGDILPFKQKNTDLTLSYSCNLNSLKTAADSTPMVELCEISIKNTPTEGFSFSNCDVYDIYYQDGSIKFSDGNDNEQDLGAEEEGELSISGSGNCYGARISALRTKGDFTILSNYPPGDFLGSIAYPVGSIYMSTEDTWPNTFLGGTWEVVNSGIFAQDTDSSGDKIYIWQRTE